VRVRQLLVKKYREIRDLQVYFVMDVSESMVFGSTAKLKNEYSVEFILSLAYTILGAGDAVGLVTFSDNVITKFKAAKGINQFYKMAKILVDPTLYGGGYNLDTAEEFILNFVTRKGSVVILVSDFYGMEGNAWKRRLKLLSAKFDVVCLVVRDPRDKYMTEEVRNVIMEDPFTGDRLLVDSAYIKERYESYTKKQDKELFGLFKEANVDALELPTDQPLLNVLMDFFKVRRSKM
ncbi:MAG: VWA domain-containing protein, partial [Nanoarchaeota archaeon]|nr:VWA domain-containing protein [Nanoarchaeota archaeon]